MKEKKDDTKKNCSIKEEIIGDDEKIYHFGIEISQSSEVFYRPLRPSSDSYLAKVGPAAAKIVKELFRYDNGVETIRVYSYIIQVKKATLFEWDPIRDILLDIAEEAISEIVGEEISISFIPTTDADLGKSSSR